MTKINIQADCENAPKKALLRDFTIAFTKTNPSLILDSMADGIHWELVGDRTIHGKAEAEKMVKEMLDGSTEELTIANIITHGDAGAVHGTMKFKDGESIFSFCDVYTFTSHAKDAKIKSITSFVIEKKSS